MFVCVRAHTFGVYVHACGHFNVCIIISDVFHWIFASSLERKSGFGIKKLIRGFLNFILISKSDSALELESCSHSSYWVCWTYTFRNSLILSAERKCCFKTILWSMIIEPERKLLLFDFHCK